jgi:uncharacterized protein
MDKLTNKSAFQLQLPAASCRKSLLVKNIVIIFNHPHLSRLQGTPSPCTFKGLTSILSVMMLISLFVPLSVASERFPKPVGAVNDFAGVISPQYERAMKSLALEVLQKTGTSIVVATFNNIGTDDPADFANRLYEAWGIGKKGEDKGVLVLLTVKERRVRIETGYGVEGILPDGLVGEILDGYVVPYLKQGDYGKGMSNAVMAISAIVAKNAKISLTGKSSVYQPIKHKPKRGSNLFTLILLVIIMTMLLGTRQGRAILPFLLLMLFMGGGGRGVGGFGSFGGGFGGFGGGMSGGGGAGRGF